MEKCIGDKDLGGGHQVSLRFFEVVSRKKKIVKAAEYHRGMTVLSPLRTCLRTAEYQRWRAL